MRNINIYSQSVKLSAHTNKNKEVAFTWLKTDDELQILSRENGQVPWSRVTVLSTTVSRPLSQTGSKILGSH